MTLRFTKHRYLALIAFGAALTGCSSSGDADDGSDTSSKNDTVAVEIFSWWTAPGEAEALQSLVDLHKHRQPSARVVNAATDSRVISGGVEAKQVLQTRLEEGNPPDSFQTNAFELKRGYLAEKPDLLQPLDELFAENGLGDDIVRELLDSVTIDGHPMAVPVNVHRENSLFYNITVFSQHDLTPPKTMAEFLEVCAKLKEAGVTPLAISTSQAWIINKVFVALAIGTLGTEQYVKYFVDKQPVDPAEMAPVIDVLDQVLTDYIDVEGAAADGFGWTQAADALHDGSAAMFIHGDWAKGYLTHLGWTPGVDFGVTTTPDSAGAFVYGADVFAVPVGAKHQPEAFDWLRTIASIDGQIAFNELKGSSPVRLSLDDDELDTMARATYADLKSSTLRLGVPAIPIEWDEGMGQLAKDHDKAALLQIFVEHPIP
jgi:glucose/mannose transport system substrate-binding protein